MLWRRAKQFREASVLPSKDDFALARAELPAALFALFAAQHPRDIVHSANTARWLVARGHTDAALIAAALLHDVGKGHQRRRDRVTYVVAGWFGATRALAAPSSRSELRQALHRSMVHSQAGAGALRAVGAPERVAELVERHHAAAGDDGMLALLQQADAAS